MKRDRGRGKSAETAAAPAAEKESAWEVNQKQQADAGMDELFAVLGYKVKSSDMADVADKLEQLDMAMATTAEDGVSVLSADTVHYNPSDLSGWVDTMLSELTTSCAFGIGVNSGESGDLRAIPGGAILSSADEDGSDYKRIKTCPGSPPQPSAVGRAMVVDSQEAGVRLVHALMACAEAVQNENMKLADALVKHVGVLAVSQAGAMRKVATYFAEALARRIYRIQPQDYSIELSGSDLLQMHFYETAPYLKFAHFTANQAILEAFAGADRVHVLDFSLKDGMQWPALIQALALRPGGPPAFKLTGIGPPQPEKSDALQEVGWKLAQVAETIGVEFEFRCLVVDSLADLDVLLDVGPSDIETVAVNSVFEMHRLLARPGSIERVLDSIKAVRPKIVTIVEQEANHNGASFVDRFNEALHYYSTMFDSLESVGAGQPDGRDVVMTDVYLGRQICNVVACDGEERVERHETLSNWRTRMGSNGFEPVHMGSNAFKQASILLALFAGGDGYRVEENEGCMMLGWHTRPLIAASAWRVNAEAAVTR